MATDSVDPELATRLQELGREPGGSVKVEEIAEVVEAIVGEIEEVMSKLKGKNSERLMDATTKIYEACGFQDITGQRITKVVGALQHIEEKVDALLNAFGDEIAKYKAANPKVEEAPAEEPQITDEDLLHGPQKKEAAMSQDDIDALLNSFD